MVEAAKAELRFMRIMKIVIIALLLSIVSTTALAKCALLTIEVKGTVDPKFAGVLTITFDSYPVPGWENDALQVIDHRFQGTFFFDSLFAFNQRTADHDCSRIPEQIRLALISDGKEVSGVTLVFRKDLKKRKPLEYALRQEIAFR